MSLYSKYFYSQQTASIMSDEAMIKYMLAFEKILATAQAYYNIVPAEVAQAIEKHGSIDSLDIDKIKEDINLSGNAAIPFVAQFTASIKAKDDLAYKYVHLGATSQDVIDTSYSLLIKDYHYWLTSMLDDIIGTLKKLCIDHRHTPMMGRTLYQHAKVITFGVKVANWLAPLISLRKRFQQSEQRTMVLTLGGAIGTGNEFINLEVKDRMAQLLGLSTCEYKANFVEYMSLVAQLNQELAKIARDTILLSQTEIAELYEGGPEGKGGSTAMPHKRNPVTATAIIANSEVMPHLLGTLYNTIPQENERSAGLWHALWDTMQNILKIGGGTIEKSYDLINNLKVDKQKMMNNIDMTNGLIFAENVVLVLAESIGKADAHALVKKACNQAIGEGIHLRFALRNFDIDEAILDQSFSIDQNLNFHLTYIEKILSKLEE